MIYFNATELIALLLVEKQGKAPFPKMPYEGTGIGGRIQLFGFFWFAKILLCRLFKPVRGFISRIGSDMCILNPFFQR
jgi:hypothetical protein